MRYQVSTVSHDFRRPIVYHRSLRRCAHASPWRQVQVRNLPPDFHREAYVKEASIQHSRRRWRQDVQVRYLLACLQPKGEFYFTFETSTQSAVTLCWIGGLPTWLQRFQSDRIMFYTSTLLCMCAQDATARYLVLSRDSHVTSCHIISRRHKIIILV